MKRHRWEPDNMLIRRLLMAWQMKVWPWTLHWKTVKYVALDQRLTDKEIAHGLELAKKHGWPLSDE